MPAVTVRLSDREAQMAREYAAQERRTLADAMRVVFLERLEDEYDLRDLRAAMREHEKDPVTFSMSEIMEKYGPSDG